MPSLVQAQTVLNLPQPGTMVSISPVFNPPIITGITIYPDNPLRFDFLVDIGDDQLQGEALRKESKKLINYFLAALTVPDDELWVNLSPYEKDRIIAEGLGNTEMGRDMLAQDYMLKQLTASLMYPEDGFGKEFWDRVHAKAQEQFGTTEIPLNTFNKIWIIPEKATVTVNETSVFVVESYLKVMLEEDYLALESNVGSTKHGLGDVTKDDIEIISGASAEVVREILLPEIEREVNEGKNFANLRQIYNSMILATWYKKNLNQSLLGQIFVGKNATDGIDVEDKEIKKKIYNQYVEAFQKGVYNYIREDYDAATQEVIPRKYFSGGFDAALLGENVVDAKDGVVPKSVNKRHEAVGVDLAMLGAGGKKFGRREFFQLSAAGLASVGVGAVLGYTKAYYNAANPEITPVGLLESAILNAMKGHARVNSANQIRAAFALINLGVRTSELVEGLDPQAHAIHVLEDALDGRMLGYKNVSYDDKIKAASVLYLLLDHPGAEDFLMKVVRNDLSDGDFFNRDDRIRAALALGPKYIPEAGLPPDPVARVLEDVLKDNVSKPAKKFRAAFALGKMHPTAMLVLELGVIRGLPMYTADRDDQILAARFMITLGIELPEAMKLLKDVVDGSSTVVGFSPQGLISAVRGILIADVIYKHKGARVYKHKGVRALKDIVKGDYPDVSGFDQMSAARILRIIEPHAANPFLMKVVSGDIQLSNVPEDQQTHQIDAASQIAPGRDIDVLTFFRQFESLFDSAMFSEDAENQGPVHGGIDFNPNNLGLQEQGNQINFNFPTVNIENIPSNIHIIGIQPVIINVTPLPTLYPLLGLEDENQEQELSRI